MKIHFDNVNLNAKTGPNVFASRLAKALFEEGIEVEFSSNNCDISLVFIEPSGAELSKKIVQRLDGVWFKPEEFEYKNKKIKQLYDSSDYVIWQSEFDKNMCQNWWGNKFGTVIYNGIEIQPKKQITNPQIQALRSKYKNIYVCSANWHKQKRLKQNIEFFLSLHAQQKDNCLIVLGSNPDYYVNSQNIFYTGSVPEEVYSEIYAIADWMIHLAWADHCPNTVIEALSQGTPVVCSSVGGTKELIGNYGLIIEDEEYNFELYDYDNPPKLVIPNNISLQKRIELDYTSIANIDIKHTVKSYIEVFKRII